MFYSFITHRFTKDKAAWIHHVSAQLEHWQSHSFYLCIGTYSYNHKKKWPIVRILFVADCPLFQSTRASLQPPSAQSPQSPQWRTITEAAVLIKTQMITKGILIS